MATYAFVVKNGSTVKYYIVKKNNKYYVLKVE